MKRVRRNIAIGVAVVVAAFITFLALPSAGVFDYDVWKREHPLAAPIAVTGVRDGTITLADGRVLRPAGVSRPGGVTAEDFDKAVRIIVAQGVVVVRDLGDGSAFLLAEPKFYNSCGTRNADGIPWKRWGGSYLQCPVSELLIHLAYAAPALEQAGLTARERWRLEGVEHMHRIDSSHRRISEALSAFRYDGDVSDLGDYDAMLELMWKPPPSP